MNPGPEVKKTTGNYITFQFPEGVDAKIVINVHERHTRRGKIESHVIYSSEEDKAYDKLVGSMAKTIALMIKHNFADGKDETNTPDELTRQLDIFKTLITTFDKDKGHDITFRLLGGAKAELFNKQQKISERTRDEKLMLEENLRWHIEAALNKP